MCHQRHGGENKRFCAQTEKSMLSEKKIYPLNSSEMGIYLDNKETTAYNLPYFLPLSDDIDIERLK